MAREAQGGLKAAPASRELGIQREYHNLPALSVPRVMPSRGAWQSGGR